MASAAQALTPDDAERDRIAVADLLLRLRRSGITDRAILGAFEAVPRRLFVPHDWADQAYSERALPIDCGQTISPPEEVGLMTAALSVQPGHRVLEIGTGSGYQSAILSHLAEWVYSIDRFRSLVEAAERRFRTLRRDNITVTTGDGTLGWPANASFDRILVTGAAEAVPEALLGQLKPDGILVIPVGPADGLQRLIRIAKHRNSLDETVAGTVRLVPLLPGKAAHL